MLLQQSALALIAFTLLSLAVPTPQSPETIAQIQQIQQMQASSPDQTGATQAALQSQINAIAAQPQSSTWTGTNPTQNAYLSQIQALQQQLGATTDAAAQAAILQQIVNVQGQMNQAAVTTNGWNGSPYWGQNWNGANGWYGNAWNGNGWNGNQQAFLAQIQALQQQLTATTDVNAQAAIQAQINAVTAQMNNQAAAASAWNPYWNNGAQSGWNGVNAWNVAPNAWNTGLTANQNHNAALTAQIQAMQQQMATMTDPNAQAAVNAQIAAVQAQMV
ncbi:hypothetical protein BCR33DRAFT_855167 [Rhizoclosmatium globosum]|uniref:Uncharacterized protein n=1 Tax=Rhizoclosmatium globosum TaxID=329046 RepID=A0A1Y2BPT2_9FUNG|nr:hypothetical protein BCR33DRAFT_855167 [Rhizoclosmatium globosum]|eukprot:ORY36742.1 hypothetical protein BCR33DRAFT_855167 [Rhizoclosmatium globosum]